MPDVAPASRLLHGRELMRCKYGVLSGSCSSGLDIANHTPTQGKTIKNCIVDVVGHFPVVPFGLSQAPIQTIVHRRVCTIPLKLLWVEWCGCLTAIPQASDHDPCAVAEPNKHHSQAASAAGEDGCQTTGDEAGRNIDSDV